MPGGPHRRASVCGRRGAGRTGAERLLSTLHAAAHAPRGVVRNVWVAIRRPARKRGGRIERRGEHARARPRAASCGTCWWQFAGPHESALAGQPGVERPRRSRGRERRGAGDRRRARILCASPQRRRAARAAAHHLPPRRRQPGSSRWARHGTPARPARTRTGPGSRTAIAVTHRDVAATTIARPRWAESSPSGTRTGDAELSKVRKDKSNRFLLGPNAFFFPWAVHKFPL